MFINITKAKKLKSKGAILIDIRSPVDFASGTLVDAINIPLRNISKLMRVERNKPVIFFSDKNDNKDLDFATNYALQMGFDTYHIGSIDNWKE